jgi:hypothetical protein
MDRFIRDKDTAESFVCFLLGNFRRLKLGAGELTRRKHTTFRTGGKFLIKKTDSFLQTVTQATVLYRRKAIISIRLMAVI